MEETRLTLLPDHRFAVHVSELQDRLKSIGESITAENFVSMLDGNMQGVLQLAFSRAEASEGTVWLVNESLRVLVAAYNTGPNADKLVGRFKQPLSAGLISMVFATEQSFLENQVCNNSNQDKSLDSMLQVQTYAMIATPFYFLEACRGVISCVQLTNPNLRDCIQRGFDDRDEAVVRHAAVTVGRLLEHRIIRATLGLQ